MHKHRTRRLHERCERACTVEAARQVRANTEVVGQAHFARGSRELRWLPVDARARDRAFDAQRFQSLCADGGDAKARPRLPEPIPDDDAVIRAGPKFQPVTGGVAHQCHLRWPPRCARSAGATAARSLARQSRRRRKCRRQRPAHADRRAHTGRVCDLDVETARAVGDPGEIAHGGAHFERRGGEAHDHAFAAHVALIVAPQRARGLSGFEPCHVADRQPTKVSPRIRSLDEPALARRQIAHADARDERLLLFAQARIDGGHREALVLRPVVCRAQLGRAGMERRGQRSARGEVAHERASAPSTTLAALRALMPVIPPIGWVPAPHRKRPGTGVS